MKLLMETTLIFIKKNLCSILILFLVGCGQVDEHGIAHWSPPNKTGEDYNTIHWEDLPLTQCEREIRIRE